MKSQFTRPGAPIALADGFLHDTAFENQKQILLGPNRLRLMAFHAIDTPEDLSPLDSIR